MGSQPLLLANWLQGFELASDRNIRGPSMKYLLWQNFGFLSVFTYLMALSRTVFYPEPTPTQGQREQHRFPEGRGTGRH